MMKQKAPQKDMDAYAKAHMQYQGGLLQAVYKISADFSKASDVGEKIQKDLEKQKQDKLAKQMDDLTRKLWGISQEHATYTIWKEDVLN